MAVLKDQNARRLAVHAADDQMLRKVDRETVERVALFDRQPRLRLGANVEKGDRVAAAVRDRVLGDKVEPRPAQREGVAEVARAKAEGRLEDR